TVVVPPLAGVLSAYGIGVADATALREQSLETELTDATLPEVSTACERLASQTRGELLEDGIPDSAISTESRVQLRYEGTDASLAVQLGGRAAMVAAFEEAHRARYGFTMDKPLVVATAVAEATGTAGPHAAWAARTEGGRKSPLAPDAWVRT